MLEIHPCVGFWQEVQFVALPVLFKLL